MATSWPLLGQKVVPLDGLAKGVSTKYAFRALRFLFSVAFEKVNYNGPKDYSGRGISFLDETLLINQQLKNSLENDPGRQ